MSEAKSDLIPLLACPNCGSIEGVEYIDYGQGMRYVEDFTGDRECTDIVSTRSAPKIGKCVECGKGIKLAKMPLRAG